ncbi:MAG: hypothetical protein J6A59_10975 [Lachnospiraceae bacterium]|nr:hypothetical protein [Lachnospiraceae bacterium]
MIILKILITIILDILLITSGIKFISTREDADGEIILNRKGIILSIVWITLFTLANIFLNSGDLHKYVIFNILCVYNTIMSYTDIQSKMVWPIISYITALIAIINLIIGNLLELITIGITIKHLIIATIIIVVFKLIKAFGDGDLKIIWVNYIMILPMYGELTPVISLITLLIVMLAFILINIKSISKGKVRNAIAFAPYLMASILITMFI